MPRTLRRSMRWGSILIALGAIVWLIQGALLISALPAVSSGFNLNPSTSSNNTTGGAPLSGHTHVWISEYAVSGAVGTFGLASLFSALASALLVVGVLLMLRRSAQDNGRAGALVERPSYVLSRGTKALVVAASVFIGAFATLGFVAFTILRSQSTGSIAATCGAWADGCPITTALELWILGSALLLVGSEIFGVVSERLAKETLGHVRIHGALFSNYATINFVGLAVVPFAVVMSPTNGGLADSLLYAALFAQLFVVPITGFIAWSWLSIQGFQSAFRQSGEPSEAQGESLPGWGKSQGATEETWADPAGVQRFSRVSPAGVKPAAGSGMASLADPDWALRIQRRMQNLERLVIAQNETISDLRSMLTRLPADPGPTDATVATRIGRAGSLVEEAENVDMPSLRIPQLLETGQGSRPPDPTPGNRSRGVGGPPDQG